MPLSADQIAELLKQPRAPRKSKPVTKHARPIQFGPVRLHDEIKRCAKRGCGTVTNYTANGIPYCSTHIIDYLNSLLVEDIDLKDCTCKAGDFSFGRIHTDDCELHPDEKKE